MPSSIFGMVGMEAPRSEIIAEHKLGRFGQPEEIASAAAFLLSSDASFHHRPLTHRRRRLHGRS